MIILNGILPVFIIILLGYFLKKKNFINETVENFINDIAYYLILPCMIFSSIYHSKIVNILNYIKIILGLYLVILLTFLFSLLLFNKIDDKRKRSLVTTSFRTNIAYIGFPIILNFFGKEGLATVAVFTGFIAPFTVIISNGYLNLTNKEKKSNENWFNVILSDPLILTSILSLLFSYYKIWLPEFLLRTINLLSDMGAPLMLLAVGAGLKIQMIKKDKILIILSTIVKLIMMPLFSYLVFKFVLPLKNNLDFIIAVLTLAFPTALASYIVVKRYNADADLCAATITVSTLFSAITISLWILFLLK